MNDILKIFFLYFGVVVWGFMLFWFILRVIIGKNWLLKVGVMLIVGRGLMFLSKKLVKEIKIVKVKDEIVIEVGVYLFWRLIRIGFVGMMIVGFLIWLLM